MKNNLRFKYVYIILALILSAGHVWGQKKDINSGDISDVIFLTPFSDSYDGQSRQVTILLEDLGEGNRELLEGTHFNAFIDGQPKADVTVKDAKTYNVRLEAIGDLYEGTRMTTFVINPADLNNVVATGIDPSYEYTGTKIEPTITGVTLNSVPITPADYTVAMAENTNVSTRGTVTLTPSDNGNFTGSKVINFAITPATLTPAMFSIPDKTYTGEPITLEAADITATFGSNNLVLGTDYEISTYTANTGAGTATVTFTGKNNFASTATVNFTISALDISNTTVVSIPDQTFTGSEIKPKPVVKAGNVTLLEVTDYELVYPDGQYTDIGSHTVIIRPIAPNMTGGDKTVTFNIVDRHTHPIPPNPPLPSVIDTVNISLENPTLQNCVTLYPDAGIHLIGDNDIMTILVFLADDCDLSDVKLVANGDTIISEERQQQVRAIAYTFRVLITDDTDIKVVGVKNNSPIGVEDLQSDKPKVYTIPNQVVIEQNATNRMQNGVRIYTMMGKLVHQQNLSNGMTSIPLTRGAYLVVAGDTVAKVMVME